MTIERRNAGRPQSLERVGSQNESHRQARHLEVLRRRAPSLALHVGNQCIHTRSKVHCQTKEKYHAPEHNFGPEIRVDTKDVQTETLTDVSSCVVTVVAERHPQTGSSHHKKRCKVLRLNTVASHKEADYADIGHFLALTPAQRAGRITEHKAQNNVGNPDRKKHDQKTVGQENVIEEVCLLIVFSRQRTRITINHHDSCPRN